LKKNIEQTFQYLRTYWKDRKIASVTPSSSFAVRRICGKIDFTRDNIIVECGPGSGVFSFAILNQMSQNSKLILIESNRDFYEYLHHHINDDRVFVFYDNAINLPCILKQLGIGDVDYLIMGIPFSFTDHELNHKIMAQSKGVLRKGGKLIVYQFSSRIKKYLKQHFEEIHICFELLNVPPLIIFEASD
jgi:phospholipid N-methyltransferase